MKLWHCNGSRSLRPLWALEEMGMDYELEVLPFPPRIFQREYLGVNSLGTVPFFVDGETEMTESVNIWWIAISGLISACSRTIVNTALT